MVYDDGAGLTGNLTAFHTRFRTSSTTRTWPIAAPAAAPFRLPGRVGRNGVPVDTAAARECGFGDHQGFRAGRPRAAVRGWSFNANYTLTASEVTSGAKQGQPLGSQPRHALNLGLKWQVNDKFSTWVRGEYRAKQFNDMNWEKEQVFYSPYWLASLGGSYAVSRT